MSRNSFGVLGSQYILPEDFDDKIRPAEAVITRIAMQKGVPLRIIHRVIKTPALSKQLQVTWYYEW